MSLAVVGCVVASVNLDLTFFTHVPVISMIIDQAEAAKKKETNYRNRMKSKSLKS